MNNVTKMSAQSTMRAAGAKSGVLLIITFFLSIGTTIAATFSQYDLVYEVQVKSIQFFDKNYTPPNFYTYFIPFIAAFLLISFIPLIAFFDRITERSWVLTILGIIMIVGSFAASIVFQISYVAYLLGYVFEAVLVIYAGEIIKKEISSMLQTGGLSHS